MSSADTHVHDDHEGRNYLNYPRGFLSWAFTLDHKRIGIMYLVAVLVAFFLGGMFAMLVRAELLTPGKTIMDADQYNIAFTMHGAIMIFLFMIPAIPAALGNFVLPLMLGAKDVAFPRLNLLSFWVYVAGTLLALYSLAVGGVDTGWTFYTPYSTTTNTAVISVTMAAFILGFSSIFTGINFIVTIHKLRPKEMSWFDMPLFLWSTYATSIIQILGTPVVAITLLLLAVEKGLKIGIFDPALGGDPVLFQHFFWFYSHPAVYLMILPAMGIMSELITCFGRKRIFGYKAIAFSSVAIAVIGFLIWGHHMYTSGQSALVGTIFSFLTSIVAIPSAIKAFNWMATLYKASVRFETPMLYAFSFLWLFLIGGLTGLFLATMATDVHLHDTYFIVAHFHYIMVGGALFGFLGGLHYWWPKMFGKMYNQRAALVGWLLSFSGFNLTFFVQFWIGQNGMPRRYYNYDPEFQLGNQISSIGAFLSAIGFFFIAAYLIHSLVKGKKASANPWGAASLEWQTASPPIPHNFSEEPKVMFAYDFQQWELKSEEEGYVLRDSRPPDDGSGEGRG